MLLALPPIEWLAIKLWRIWQCGIVLLIRIILLIIWRLIQIIWHLAVKVVILALLLIVSTFALVWLILYLRAGSNLARVWQGNSILTWCKRTLRSLLSQLFRWY